MPKDIYGKDKKKGGGILKYFVIALAAFVLTLVIISPRQTAQPTANPFENYTEGGTKVAFVEFSDFECPYCGQVQFTVSQLKTEYAGKVNFVFKNFPVHGASAELAAQAAECAAEQGFLEQYHLKLFQNQQTFSEASLKSLATGLGIDETAFNACLSSGRMAGKVASSFNEGVSLGVRATPTFFINGRKIEGAADISEFKKAIEAELLSGLPSGR